MLALLISRKGLLLKSFFICIFSSAIGAKTLIFQSNDANLQSEPASAEVGNNASVQIVSPPATAAVSSINSELFFLVEQLKQEVMMLRGLVEEQDYEIRQMQKLSKERYRDMDQRLQDLAKKVANADNVKAAPAPSQSSASATVAGSANVVVPVAGVGEVVPVKPPVASVGVAEQTEEQKVAYQSAYNYVRDKNFPEAIDALHAYVEKYPEGDLTGNAFYWLGEVYLVLPKLEQAKQAFSIVVKAFPGHRKLPDAIYKLAVTLDRLQDPAGAEQYLKQVQQQFPNSTAAKLAGNYTISR